MQRGNLSIRLDRGSVLEEASYKIYTRGFLKILLGICLFIPISFAQESAKNASEDVKQIEGEDLNEEELAKDASTEINVKNADIAQIVRIFSKKTKRNFIMDERVKGKVSIYLPGKVSANESIRILDAVLNFKGFTSVPIGQNLWKIVPSKDAKQTTIPTLMEGREGSPTASMVTRLVQLKYVSAEEVKQLISPLASPDGLTNSYAGTNSLIIIDSEENIERLIKIIDTLDVPFSDREMSIIPILNADATELAEKLNEILGEGSKKGGDSGTDFGLDLVRARIREAASAAMAAQRTSTTTGSAGATTVGGSSAAASVNGASVGSRAREPKIIPDQRTNSIIVVADEDMTARIRALISKLDSKVDLSGTRFYVYRCKHAKADEIAEVLSGLTGSSSGTSRGADRGATDLISGGTTTGLGTSNRNRNTRDRGPTSSSSRLGITSRTLGQSLLGNQQQRGTTTANIGENISITADQATNSLIIQASKSDYEKVLELLKQIDIKRRQVLVEAVLLEVTLNQNNTMSAAFITSGGGDDGGVISSFNGNQIIGLLNDPASVQDFAIAAASSGSLTIGDALTIPSQSMLLNAVRSNDNVNVLSAPTLLTTDNEEAQIVVGQNVPFLASTATDSDNLNNTFNQIDRQDVGITLRLTPQISSGEAITLKIFTEVSALQSVDPELGPTTSVRTSETAVITRDGQMIVIGGLMADGINETDRGVPFLKDIPVLGHMFRSVTDLRQRTNLLILITPRIVRDQFDARDVTVDQRDKIENEITARELYPSRDEFLRNPDIDSVVTEEYFEGQIPSTMTAPRFGADSRGDSPGSLVEAPSTFQPGGDDGVMEFTVKPKFSAGSAEHLGAQQPDVATALQASNLDSGRARLSSPLPAGSQRGALVVLRLTGSSSNSASLPFSITSKNGLASIFIPEGSGASASGFFRTGQSVGYAVDDAVLNFEVAGVFTSIEEASKLFEGLGQDWHTLSPYEIMSLGEGPWIRAR